MSTEKSGFSYQPALDGLRGLAVTAVITLHAFVPFAVIKDVKILAVGGSLGVDIFFVLSGFLITALLLKEWKATEKIDFKKFYIRRALRLLPVLYVFLTACVLHAIFFRAAEESNGAFSDVVAISFYLSNWIPINLYPLRHTWSLAVEEQFYLIYPVLLCAFLLVAKRLHFRREWIVGILLVLIAGVAAHRAYLFDQSGFSWRIYVGSDTRADSLLIGCLVGVLVSWQMLPEHRWFRPIIRMGAVVAAGALVYMVLVIGMQHPFLYYGGYTLVAFLAGLIILSLQISPPMVLKVLLEWRVLVWIGRLSYGIYLWHKLVYVIVDSLMPMISIPSYTIQRIILPFSMKVACSLFVAGVSYYCLEKPFLRLKERFAVRTDPAENSRKVGANRLDPIQYAVQRTTENANLVKT